MDIDLRAMLMQQLRNPEMFSRAMLPPGEFPLDRPFMFTSSGSLPMKVFCHVIESTQCGVVQRACAGNEPVGSGEMYPPLFFSVC